MFDWDGTLVDSAATSYACYRRVFTTFGIPFDQDRFRATYSPDWYRTYRDLGLPEADWPAADRLWLEEYTSRETPLIAGAGDLLAQLADVGLALGLVTSGDRSRVAREIALHGFTGRFAVFLGREDLPRRKPAPDGLLLAMQQLRIRPENSAYVGDSPEDVEMARAAGVFSIGVPGGFPNEDALRASRPDLLAPDLDAVVTALLGRAAGA